jgi:hypothetical protein
MDTIMQTYKYIQITSLNDVYSYFSLKISLSILTFIIYGCTVLSLHQDRAAELGVEGGSIIVVLSHKLFHSPLGLMDWGVYNYFRLNTGGLTADEAITKAIHNAVSERVSSVFPGGQGVGEIVTVTAAFRLFGPHMRALIYLYLLVIGVSVAAFLVRFRGEQMAAVPIVLFSLTLFLFTPLSEPVWAAAILIGGIRYYAVVGILPALHWCFEILGGRARSRSDTIVRCGLLAVQICILGLAILVRGAPAYLIVPVAATAIFTWLRKAERRARRRTLLYFLGPTATLIFGLTVLPRLAFPEYAATGRLFSVIWHRAFVGFGLNPDWPFQDLRDKYNCTSWFPQGLVAGVVDGNGHCVWVTYGTNPTRPPHDVGGELYDGNYDAALRQAVFDVIRLHPWQAFKTFFYYKPKFLLGVITDTLRPDWSNLGHPIALLAILQMIVCGAFIIARPASAPAKAGLCQVSILALFIIPALGPQLLAWPSAHTSVDLFVYVLCGGILLFWLPVSVASRSIANSRGRSEGQPGEATPGADRNLISFAAPLTIPAKISETPIQRANGAGPKSDPG